MTKKGMNNERKLVKWLNDNGVCAVRVAGSGAGTTRPLPDSIASNKVNIFGIELKSSSKNTIYINENQIKDLIKFCECFGAIPLVCANFTYMDYYFISPYDMSISNNGNYKISREQVKFSDGFKLV